MTSFGAEGARQRSPRPIEHVVDHESVALTSLTGQYACMRWLVGVVVAGMGLLLLGGPTFGAVAWLSGNDVVVSGGQIRVVFDLIAGTALVAIGARELRTASLATG